VRVGADERGVLLLKHRLQIFRERVLYLGVIFCMLILCAENNTAIGKDLLPLQENEWVRDAHCPCDAITESEKIAADVMRNDRRPITKGSMQAKYIGEDRYYSLVEVIEITENKFSPYNVETFRMLGSKIAGLHSEYRQETEEIPFTRQDYARKIAMKFENGTVDNPPLIFEENYIYRPKKGDKCEIIVDENSTKRVLLHTFTFDVCNNYQLVERI
jgi:hypothetical protein